MKTIISLLNFLLLLGIQATAQFDLAIINGRVIDPETSLDDIRNIGITKDRIVEITSKQEKLSMRPDLLCLLVLLTHMYMA